MKIVERLAQRASFRSAMVIGAAVVVLAAASATSPRQVTRLSTPEGPGSVFGAPHLPAGFTKTFTSRYVDAGQVRLHAVIGGAGPPLLLVHGWPQTWYQWRLVMPALARNFTVIAVDQRGIGLSDKPATGYDVATLANDLVALMDALGYRRFAMVGFDTGMPIAYALASDHPERLDRLVIGESIVPGVTPSPPLLVPGPLNARLWHIAFNRLAGDVNERLVRGREDVYFGAEYANSAGTPLPDEVVRYYIDRLASNPDALRGSFEFYRAIDITTAQNAQRKTRRLTLPVLAIGGAKGIGEGTAATMKLVADDVQSVIIPGSGHWVAEEAPEQLLSAITGFLAPYRTSCAIGGDAVVFETLTVRQDGAVLFASIAAPPMNLLGPELVRDLVSLIQRAETDDAVQVLVFKSADPEYFISHVDVTRINEYREETAKLTGEASLGLFRSGD